jgi:anti-anti-sigma factor
MTDELIDVRLLDLPVPLHVRTAAHLNGLQRELELIRIGGADATGVPHRLRLLIDELTDQYGGVGDQPRAELEAAARRGEDTIDLVYRIPASAGAGSRRLDDLLDQVDEYCRGRGHLLTQVTPPDALDYRRWFLGEFARQCRGDAPVPWPEHRPSLGAQVQARSPAPTDPPSTAEHGWTVETQGDATTIAISGALDLVSAPALRELLVEATTAGPVTVIDLADCDFIDSVGVSVLAAALLRAEGDGAQICFRLGDAARRVLSISGVLDRLTLVDDGPVPS